MGGGQDRHVIQMIANASLDVIEEVVWKENPMCVCVSVFPLHGAHAQQVSSCSRQI